MARSRFPFVPAALALALCGAAGLALAQSPAQPPVGGSGAQDRQVAEVGKPAPDFSLTDLDSQWANLKDFREAGAVRYIGVTVATNTITGDFGLDGWFLKLTIVPR